MLVIETGDTQMTFPRNVVIATGTFAVVRFGTENAGIIEMAADAVGTEAVALGHARFIAPHVSNWSVVVAA